MGYAGTLTTDQLKDRLLADLERLVYRYAPPAQGSFTKAGKYFTLNPGRADRSVGSFCVTMTGPMAGRWRDFAPSDPDRGDVIDLIGLSLGLTDQVAKFREARAFLGLATEDPAMRAARDAQAAKSRAQRDAKDKSDQAGRAKRLEKMQGVAAAVWLSAKPGIAGTPVQSYLAARGIDLALLGHQPGAIRYHPECRYYFPTDVVDQSTGEVRQPRSCT